MFENLTKIPTEVNIASNEEIDKIKNIPLKDREFLYKGEELKEEENEDNISIEYNPENVLWIDENVDNEIIRFVYHNYLKGSVNPCQNE